jgi:hypothetical protein
MTASMFHVNNLTPGTDEPTNSLSVPPSKAETRPEKPWCSSTSSPIRNQMFETRLSLDRFKG